jgi:hypothetical protein
MRSLRFLWSGKSGNDHLEAGGFRPVGDDTGTLKLSEFDERTQANMDVVLDEICGELPHGGDHESRKAIAEQLMQAARGGKTGLRELTYVGRRALIEVLSKQRSA